MLNAILFKAIQCQFCMASVGYITQQVMLFNMSSVNGVTKSHLGSCVGFCFNERQEDVAYFNMTTRQCFCFTFQSEIVLYKKQNERMVSLEVILRSQSDQSKLN